MAQTKMIWGGGRAVATLDGHFNVYPTEGLIERAMDGEYELTIETADSRRVKDYLSYTEDGVYVVVDIPVVIRQKGGYAIADGVTYIEVHDE